MINLILDSSVVAKWFFPEEQSDAALRIRDDFVNKKITISVPTLIFYEVNNLLKTAVKSLRIDKKKATNAYEGFLDLGFISYSTKDLLENALEKAINLDISSYDASYIVLAEYLKEPFFTADLKLLKNAKSELVKSLQDYPA